MELLQRATVQNNMGAHMLDVNNTLGAIQAFQQAIQTMKMCTKFRVATTSAAPTLHSTTMNDGYVGGRTMSNDMYLYNSLRCVSSIVHEDTRRGGCGRTEEATNAPKQSNANQGKYQYFLHDRALMLPTNIVSRIDNDLEVEMRNASIVMMFNFCVACHQFGMDRCEAATVTQALQVYELVVEMILQQFASTYSEPYLRVVLCLALNNMTSIHYDFCEYDKGMTCIEYMQTMLIRHSDMMDTIALQFIPQEEWNDVKLNALFLQAPSVASAA